ncbi:hypothetical protein V2G26_002103 [Clonostachys chloroleuca]
MESRHFPSTGFRTNEVGISARSGDIHKQENLVTLISPRSWPAFVQAKKKRASRRRIHQKAVMTVGVNMVRMSGRQAISSSSRTGFPLSFELLQILYLSRRLYEYNLRQQEMTI